jgi:hypothetical protein
MKKEANPQISRKNPSKVDQILWNQNHPLAVFNIRS